MKNFLILILGISMTFFACNGGGSPAATSTAGTGSLEGFTMLSNPNSTAQTAQKKDGNGDVLEEGSVVNGQREGTWLTYYDGRKAGIVKTATSYINNEIQGAHLEFDNIGRLELKSFYSKGVLNGPYVKFQYGKPKEEATYKAGELDGMYRTYYANGKKQQETEYKNGKKDGRSLFYNEAEQIIMDYQYKNGEQVSGGQVTPPPTESKE